MNVFTYWEGFVPEYIKICIATMRKLCGPNFILLTPDNLDLWLKGAGLSDGLKRLKLPAHRADCIRVAIINKYGGLWVDCDTIFSSSISAFEEEVNTYIKSDFIYSKWDDGRCLNGYFYGKKDNQVTTEWLNKINKILDKGSGGTWTQFGEKILGPIIKFGSCSSTYEIDRRTFLPINVDKIPWVFFEPIHWSAFEASNTVAFGLNHSWFYDNAREFVYSSNPWDGTKLINSLIREMR